nr:VanW family protein [bacterium]
MIVTVTVVGIASICVGMAIKGAIRKQQMTEEQRRLEQQQNELLAQQTFYPGVTLDGQDIGGKTKDEVINSLLSRQSQMRLDFRAYITHEATTWTVSGDTAQLKIDYEQALERAWNLGREGTREARLSEIDRAAREGAHFTTQTTWNREAVQDFIRKAADTLISQPIDAKVIKFDPELPEGQWWEFSDDVSGVSVDVETIENAVLKALEDGAYGQSFEMVTQTVPAGMTRAMLEGATKKISSYTTPILGSSARDVNINLASSAVAGSIIMPGETFSYNKTTGPRTVENGYVEADIIVNGKLVPDPGGGVCQVAGTLYNAVVCADLTIVERHQHSLTSLYIAPALDATVFYDSNTDFRFRNDGDTPVYIARKFDKTNRKLTIMIYGAPLKDGITIKTESEVTGYEPAPEGVNEVLDTSLQPDERVLSVKKRIGTRATAYKVYLDKDGKELRREVLSNDFYKPTKETWLVGPAPSPTPEATPQATPVPTPGPTPVVTP